MTNYEQLVEALRSASTVSTAFGKLMADAADAIEALQAQLPKHGEWIHIEGDDPWEWTCSVCMKKSDIHGEEPAFCPKCGADMRKMEVQE
jgi:rubrerythrin